MKRNLAALMRLSQVTHGHVRPAEPRACGSRRNGLPAHADEPEASAVRGLTGHQVKPEMLGTNGDHTRSPSFGERDSGEGSPAKGAEG